VNTLQGESSSQILTGSESCPHTEMTVPAKDHCPEGLYPSEPVDYTECIDLVNKSTEDFRWN